MKKRLTTKEFVSKCKQIHGSKYDYSLVEYSTAFEPVIIICPIHGPFKQDASNHLHHKAGCKKCGATNVKLSANEFIKRARTIHGKKYDYSQVNYINTDTKVKIICKIHGGFLQNPSSHVNQKQGCPKCGNNCLNTVDFIERTRKIHKERYDYTLTKFITSRTKVSMCCKKHGTFYQLPHNHLSGGGCPKCSCNISKPEVEWLNHLNVPETYRQKTLNIKNKKVKVDAYNPTINTIYEFWGDFFHGNPKVFKHSEINPKNKQTFGNLYRQTQLKRKVILEAGYNLVEIWENDWKHGRYTS